MEKSNQSLILGLVIGAAVVLAGGFFFYFGAGCADGDCLGFVQRTKIKPPPPANQPVAEQPKPAEAKPEKLDIAKLFENVKAVPAEKSDPIFYKDKVIAKNPNMENLGTMVDQNEYAFPYGERILNGIAASRIESSKSWMTAMQNNNPSDENSVFHIFFDTPIYGVPININNVTASLAFNTGNVVGQPELHLYVLKYNPGNFEPWTGTPVAVESVTLANSNQRYFLETSNPFTLESGYIYDIMAIIEVDDISENESESVYGWFSEVNYNTP